MTGADMSKSLEDPTAYGLHRLVDGKVTGIAMPVWNWGRYYELIVRSLLHGTWDETSDDNQVRAVNYWYGMSSGVIDFRYAPGLPYQTRKLVQLLRNGIVEGSINLWRRAPQPERRGTDRRLPSAAEQADCRDELAGGQRGRHHSAARR